MMKTVVGTLFTLGLLALCAPALASGEGTAVGVNPDASASLENTIRILEAGTDVSVGELITTGPKGQVQILFDDQTRLVVGPGSSLLIEEYLLSSNDTAEKLAINALGGSFRFITGNSPKPAYSIKTPTAAIAVRGTKFDLLVTPTGTGALLYEGALQICGTTGKCAELVDRCDMGATLSDETEVMSVSDSRHRPIARQFRFARFQTSLLQDFRVSGAIFCTETKPETASLLVTTHGSDKPSRPDQPVPSRPGDCWWWWWPF